MFGLVGPEPNPVLESSTFTSDGNDELLKKNLDLVEERREDAIVQLAYYQHKLKQGYDMNVKLRSLAPGDLVLRKVLGNTKNPLGENWDLIGRVHIASHQWQGYVRTTWKI